MQLHINLGAKKQNCSLGTFTHWLLMTMKRAILLTACSPSTFELLRSLIQLDKPSDKTYAQLVKQLTDHYHRYYTKPVCSISQPVQRIAQGKAAPTQPKCYRCGGLHEQNNCRFIQSTCHSCGKKGHISCVCRSTPKTPSHAPTKGRNVHNKKRNPSNAVPAFHRLRPGSSATRQ